MSTTNKHISAFLSGTAILVGLFAFGPKPAVDADKHAVTSMPDSTESFPKGYFDMPTSGTAKLTGTFGELRPDHFHSGIDIKSNTGGVGQPIYAAADGFIDLIKVQSSGYGNVLYIKHPNGYTTLYAHLHSFYSELAKYIKDNQYKKESFEIELRPPDGQYKVKKGQQIGTMGNTGSSFGPHLHFEIRKTATGKALNPLLFGLDVADKRAPELRDMKIYILNDKREVIGTKALSLKKNKKGVIGLQGDTVKIGAWRIGLGVKAYDQMTGFNNDNGIYAIHLSANNKKIYQWKMDELDFDETRYMNAHVDYPAYKKYGAWFHRCFTLPGNHLNNYLKTDEMGAIELSASVPVKIELKILDAHGNAANLSFYLLRDENMETITSKVHQYVIPYNSPQKLDIERLKLNFAAGSFYETLLFQYDIAKDSDPKIYSTLYQLHDNRTPIHKYIDIGIKPDNLPEHLYDKAVIANCNTGKPDNCGGTWKDGHLFARIRNFGNYCIMADTTPPKIVPVVFDDDMRKNSTISFRISDDFAISGSANGLTYRGTIDGQWVLFEYDKKKDRLTYTFDEHVSTGQHNVQLWVKDDRGNQKTWDGAFKR